LPLSFTLGAPSTGGGYPTLYLLGWASYGATQYLYQGAYSGSGTTPTWTTFGSSQTNGINPDLPQGGAGLWRLDVAAAGSGVTGDLLAHCIDTAIWLNGPIHSVCAMTETFVKERMHNLTGQVEKVGIDDACAFLCHFANGSLATFESTRYARGHKAEYTFEINGENMSLAWDLHDLHRLQVFDYKEGEGRLRGWKSVHVTDNSPEHPYMDKWWVPGLQIGYEHTFVHQVADFVEALAQGKPAAPTFRDALATDQVTDAVLESAKTRRWERIENR
jgi:predicted dehydrogenase